MIRKINYADKTVGGKFTASDANEIKTSINSNADVLSENSQFILSLQGGSLGSIKPTDAAPTPGRNGNYTFSIGGDKPAWLTAEAGITEVKAGDGVAVVYTEPNVYSYTHVDISSDFATTKSVFGFDSLPFPLPGFYTYLGGYSENASWKSTPYLVAEEYILSNINLMGNFSVGIISFFDITKKFISCIGNANSQLVVANVTYPPGTAYFTISLPVADTTAKAFILHYSAYSDLIQSFRGATSEKALLFNKVGFYDRTYILHPNASYESTDLLKAEDYLIKNLVFVGNYSISGVVFWDKNLNPIGFLGRENTTITVATLTYPEGTAYFTISKGVNSTPFSADVTKYNVLGAGLGYIVQSVIRNNTVLFVDTNTPIAVLEKRTGYYIETNGVIQGDGIFPDYYLNISSVTPGDKIKIYGTGAGSIAAAAFYSDLALTNLISYYGWAGENNIKVTVPTGAVYCAACCHPTAIVGLYTYIENDLNVVAKLRTDVDALMNTGQKVVVDWGDSLTAGAGGNGTSYSSVLQTLLGDNYNVLNAGVGGETTGTIAARQGGTPFVLQNDISLPATTDYVPIALYNTWGLETLPLRQGGAATINPCYLDNIPCTLSWDATNGLRIKRNAAGTARTIVAKTILFTNYMKLYRKPFAMVIWVGTNGVYTDINDLIGQIKAMIQFSGIEKVIVIGLHFIYAEKTVEVRKAEEVAMSKAFGSYYINWREYLATHAVYDAGLTPTQADLDAMAAGICPPTFLTDAVHLNATAYTLLANLIYQRFQLLGII